MVKVKIVKIENRCCQNLHYNINIYIYIYSEQMTVFPKSKMTILTMTTLTTVECVFVEYAPRKAVQSYSGFAVLSNCM